MSLRGKLGIGHQEQPPVEVKSHDIEQREIAHQAIFSEVAELQSVCKFLLDGHPVLPEPLCDEDGTRYIVCCISGTTTRIKIIGDKYVDDYSVNEYICSRKLTTYSENRQSQTEINFDVTSGYMNGFSEAELATQCKALYDLQTRLLLVAGYIKQDTQQVEDAFYAA
jgi:hypothetical protein